MCGGLQTPTGYLYFVLVTARSTLSDIFVLSFRLLYALSQWLVDWTASMDQTNCLRFRFQPLYPKVHNGERGLVRSMC